MLAVCHLDNNCHSLGAGIYVRFVAWKKRQNPSVFLVLRPGQRRRSTPRRIALQGVTLAVTLTHRSHPEVKTSGPVRHSASAGGLPWPEREAPVTRLAPPAGVKLQPSSLLLAQLTQLGSTGCRLNPDQSRDKGLM